MPDYTKHTAGPLVYLTDMASKGSGGNLTPEHAMAGLVYYRAGLSSSQAASIIFGHHAKQLLSDSVRLLSAIDDPTAVDIDAIKGVATRMQIMAGALL